MRQAKLSHETGPLEVPADDPASGVLCALQNVRIQWGLSENTGEEEDLAGLVVWYTRTEVGEWTRALQNCLAALPQCANAILNVEQQSARKDSITINVTGALHQRRNLAVSNISLLPTSEPFRQTKRIGDLD